MHQSEKCWFDRRTGGAQGTAPSVPIKGRRNGSNVPEAEKGIPQLRPLGDLQRSPAAVPVPSAARAVGSRRCRCTI
jgi:hypothetical protein